MIIKRTEYLEKIKPFMEKPVIKVITGMRRAGKSYFIKQLIQELENKGIKKDNILYINKESLDFEFIKNHKDLDRYVKKNFEKNKKIKRKKYLFIDEIQEISGWEKAIASFFSSDDIDIYITGSNAHLLSSDLATHLSGRYIEFTIYTLGFREFLKFRGEKKEAIEKEFKNFLQFGGLPALHNFELKEEIIYPYIISIYNTIVLEDVIKKHNLRNIQLLENIARFVFDNIGNIFSAKRISDYLKSQQLRIGVGTVQNYLSYLSETFVINKIPRFDLKGKRFLEIYEKYFLGDIGIRHAILGFKEGDISGVLENIVYLELKRRNYKVFIGKWNGYEIDFIAEKEKKKIYIQVAYLLSSQKTLERESAVLKKIPDNYPKFIISMDKILGEDVEGIKRMNMVDFLLNPEIF